jgi:hypothetical protein
MTDNTLKLGGFQFHLPALLAQIAEMTEDGQETIGFLFSLVELRARKGADYGARVDTYRNYQIVSDLKGVPGWHAAADRLVEKAVRLGNLVGKDLRGEPISCEAIDDTLRDIALIAAIAYAMRRRNWREGEAACR